MKPDPDLIAVDQPVLTRLLRRGFALPHDDECGLVVLLRGRAGTGKSTLALQLLCLMQHIAAPRYYCSLEQSNADLQFKLGSMLAARAISEALVPKHSDSTFACDWNEILDSLRRSHPAIGWPAALKDVRPEVGGLRLALYDEWSGKQLRRYKLVHDALSRAVTYELQRAVSVADGQHQKASDRRQRWTRGADHIKFLDGRREPDHAVAPIGAYRSRVVLASRVLDPVIEELRVAAGKDDPADILRAKRPVVVVDGLSLLSAAEREAIELQNIVERMRRNFQLGILVYEPNEDESTSLDHHADMVIHLEKRTIERPLAYLIHELCIRKARYQEAILGQHQFKIRGFGIEVFPSLHLQVRHYKYMDLELKRSLPSRDRRPDVPRGPAKQNQTGVGSLIDAISAPLPGESVVLLGARNSFKTELCLDFLARGRWGCPKRTPRAKLERGLLVSLSDNAPDIQRGLCCPWQKTRSGGCSSCGTAGNRMKERAALISHAWAFCQRPGYITPSEFFHYLQQRIEKHDKDKEKLRRIVFWDLTQMDYRFPLFREDRMLLPALMDMFKTNGLTALFMGAGNAENTRGASAIADHVLFCWRSRYVKEKRGNSRAKTGPYSSLMIYVDRASASSNQDSKALYCIPIHRGDKLEIPADSDELRERYSLNPHHVDDPEDQEQISRIVRMQDVAEQGTVVLRTELRDSREDVSRQKAPRRRA